jgi:hypothetical protein
MFDANAPNFRACIARKFPFLARSTMSDAAP